MLRVAAVLLASAHDAPAKVMVTTPPVALAVAVQLVNPLTKVTVGDAGTVKPEGKVTLMVLPVARWPLAEVVKPSVHVAVEFAVWAEPEKETAVGVVAAAITTLEAGLAAVVSCEVATLNPLAG